jgi:hypothetical protein
MFFLLMRAVMSPSSPGELLRDTISLSGTIMPSWKTPACVSSMPGWRKLQNFIG